jgi:hypothetical protein
MAEEKITKKLIPEIKKPTVLFKVMLLPPDGKHSIEIAALPAIGDPGVIGLILADALRAHAGLYAELGMCTREEAEARIWEVLQAEMAAQTGALTEFARPIDKEMN